MNLLRALKTLAVPPPVFLAGWCFSCFLLLAGSGLLLWKWPAFFPQKNSAVLAADTQLQLRPDERISILEQFLKQQSSPLATQAAIMVEVADVYKFDWRLLPAIAGKESSFGKEMPWDSRNDKPSYNAWGWGVYGDKTPSFPSWEEAIKTVAEGLRQEYYNKGYVTPEIIMKKFTPRPDSSWAKDVEVIMVALNAMEQIAPEEKQSGSKE